jgi:hypothetical protein
MGCPSALQRLHKFIAQVMHTHKTARVTEERHVYRHGNSFIVCK